MHGLTATFSLQRYLCCDLTLLNWVDYICLYTCATLLIFRGNVRLSCFYNNFVSCTPILVIVFIVVVGNRLHTHLSVIFLHHFNCTVTLP